jgi:hypothetical protein
MIADIAEKVAEKTNGRVRIGLLNGALVIGEVDAAPDERAIRRAERSKLMDAVRDWAEQRGVDVRELLFRLRTTPYFGAKCTHCDGTGMWLELNTCCKHCDGTGRVT